MYKDGDARCLSYFMHVRLQSLVLIGLEGQVVDVEVDVASGFPQFLLVGLVDTVVQEARERVRSAIKNSGYKFPDGRVTVSLSPSHVRKEGAWFDLPIAVGILLASQQIQDPLAVISGTAGLSAGGPALWCGELGLDGSVRATGRELAQVLAVGDRRVVVAAEAVRQLSGVNNLLWGVNTIRELGEQITDGQIFWEAVSSPTPAKRPMPAIPRLGGLEAVERAVQIGLTGRHHLVLYGPPGTGKSAVMQLAAEWLPDLSAHYALEVGRIWSASGIDPASLLRNSAPPVRTPHHTASAPAMVGGGQTLKAGEISLSHHGLLCLDELPEFRREVLEALREPMQEKHITINRAAGAATFPADMQILATLNPCPCGFFGDDSHPCTCTAASLDRYRRKLSGPLLDRFSLAVRVDRVESTAVLASQQDLISPQEILDVRQRITQARGRLARWPDSDILSDDVRQLILAAADQFSLSPRAITSTLAVAKSIAAFEGRIELVASDMAEALQYRWRGWEAVS